MSETISRRRILQLGAGGLALLATGSLTDLAVASDPISARRSGPSLSWLDEDIANRRRLMRHRQVSSVELTNAYLRRIARVNPVLHAGCSTRS